MKRYLGGILAVLPLLSLKSCASPQPPKPAPRKVEVSALQKNIHEHQKLRSETGAKLDDSSIRIDTLFSMLTAPEEKQTVQLLSHMLMN